MRDLSQWLASPTDPTWAAQACDHIRETLCDHAHCEKKAAVSAMALINAYPGDGQLVAMVAALAAEELEHFREIFVLLGELGVELPRDEGDPYAQKLMEVLRQPQNQRKTDRLLVSALIEARSCERFALLAAEMERRAAAAPVSGSGSSRESRLADMFRRFEVSEAGHAAMFTGLALRDDPAGAAARLGRLREYEAQVVAGLPLAPRIH